MIPNQIGRYQIKELIGKGGVGEVYRVYDPELNRDAAIKFVALSNLERDIETQKRFRREVKAAAQLKHPHIITIYDVDLGYYTSLEESTMQLPDLRQFLIMYFNISELDNLCFDLKVNLENISGDTLEAKAREIISYFKRHGRMNELTEMIQKLRPHVAWQGASHKPLPQSPQVEIPPYMIMELLAGGTLVDRLQSKILPWKEIFTLLSYLWQAVSYAHEVGVIHRDLKPANIMFANEDNISLRLVDFGLARWQGSEFTSQSGVISGTPAYMSPEQILGQAIDHRVDIYALGVICFEMATGRLPFNAAAPFAIMMQHVNEAVPLPSSINPNISIQLDMVILKAMDKNPGQRFQSVDEMLIALQAIDNSGFKRHLLIEETFQEPSPVSTPSIATMESLPIPFQAPPRTPFFAGRNLIISQLQSQLQPNGAILGLVGLGGVGKTSLAIELTHAFRDKFPDGILWANLGTTTPETELINFAATFGRAEESATRPDLSSKSRFVRDMLAEKSILIVLDNVESSKHSQKLLVGGPKSCTLITSRNHKTLANLGATIIDITPFSQREGIAYLHSALDEARVNSELYAANQIVKQTGGLPLAMSIVAGFLNETDEITLSEYAELLNDEQTRLENLADWEDQSRDVAASFELSYQKLPTPIQKLFASLAVFGEHDFSSESIVAITQLSSVQIKLGLGRLVSLSLLETMVEDLSGAHDTQNIDRSRYRLHPLLKVFAHQKLEDEVERKYRQHAAVYFANFADSMGKNGYYKQLEAEWPIIYDTLRWAYDTQDWITLFKGITGVTHINLGVAGFLDGHGYWHKASRLLEWLGESELITDNPMSQAEVSLKQGIFAWRKADVKVAQQQLDYSITLLSAIPPNEDVLLLFAYTCELISQLMEKRNPRAALEWSRRGIDTLQNLQSKTAMHEKGYLYIRHATILGKSGQLDKALQFIDQGINLLPAEPSSARISAYTTLSAIHHRNNKYGEMSDCLQDAVNDAQDLGDYRRLANLWRNMALVEELKGHFDESIKFQEKALKLYLQIGDIEGQGHQSSNLGLTYIYLGEDELATKHLTKAIDIAEEYQLYGLEALASINLVRLSVECYEFSNSVLLLERAYQISQHPDHMYLLPEILYLRASISLGAGNSAEALTIIDDALKMAPGDISKIDEGICWRVKGDILVALNNFSQAESAYQQSLQIISGLDLFEQSKSQLALGQYYLTMKEEDKAKPLLEQTLHTFTNLKTKREISAANNLLRQINQ